MGGSKKKKDAAAGSAAAAAKPAAAGKGGASKPAAAAAAATAADQQEQHQQHIRELFVKLEGHVKKNEFSKIVKTSDEILQASRQLDVDALHCKVVALIQINKIKDALTCLDAAEQQKQKHGVTAGAGSKGKGAAAAAAGPTAMAVDGTNGGQAGAPDVLLPFERAYCLYRQNRLTEALGVLQHVEKTAGVLQLEGQILYRMGNSAECIARFEELMRRFKSETAGSAEVKTNVVAAYVMGGRAAEVKQLMEQQLRVSPRDAFDVAYNAACALIELKDFPAAEEMLLLARRVGQEVLIDEELTTQEIEEELAPITVQLAYVQQVQGRRVDAMESYNAFLKRKPADAPSVAVAINNLIALRGAKDVADGLKRLEKIVGPAATASSANVGGAGGSAVGSGNGSSGGGSGSMQFLDGLESKLSATQKATVLFNRCLLLLHGGKLDEAKEMLPLLQPALQQDPKQLLALHAALILRSSSSSSSDAAAKAAQSASTAAAAATARDPAAAAAAIDHLNKELFKLSEAVVRTEEEDAKESRAEAAAEAVAVGDTVRLLTAQAAASEGSFKEAAEALAGVDVRRRFCPAVVATLVDLKERAGDVEGAGAVLDEAVQWWEGHTHTHPNNGTEQAGVREQMLQSAAEFRQRHGQLAEAAKLYEKLAKSATTANARAEAHAALVLCTAAFDPASAEKMASDLAPMPRAAGLDPQQLIQAGSAFLQGPSARASTKRPSADTDDEGREAAVERARLRKARKKKKRKVILPKGFDPANPGPPPDPERWLPRRERSSYKPKKRDKKKIDVRGAQGAVVRTERAGGDGHSGSGGGGASASASATAAAGSGSTGTAAKGAEPAKKKGGKKGRK